MPYNFRETSMVRVKLLYNFTRVEDRIAFPLFTTYFWCSLKGYTGHIWRLFFSNISLFHVCRGMIRSSSIIFFNFYYIENCMRTLYSVLRAPYSLISYIKTFANLLLYSLLPLIFNHISSSLKCIYTHDSDTRGIINVQVWGDAECELRKNIPLSAGWCTQPPLIYGGRGQRRRARAHIPLRDPRRHMP